MKQIAIIGKPNVGKSSLFNRIVRERDAITSEKAGTTRDVKKREIEIGDERAILIDTGGFDTSSELFQKVTDGAIKVALESDIVLYMVDGRDLSDEKDKKTFYKIAKKVKNIALVVNKLDNDKLEEKLWEFSDFGIDDTFAISISHNRRINKLIEWIHEKVGNQKVIVDRFDRIETKGIQLESEISVSIIGRVNVGKSSLLNAITKSDRSIVSPVAGTTIDPIDEVFQIDGREIKFVDTAGIRRRGKIAGIEKYALGRTESMLERSDIALLVLDASEGFHELDEKIAGLVDKHQLATIIVLNKWDERIYEYEEAVRIIRDKFKFLYFAPILTISALTHQRVHKIYELLFRVYENYTKRMPTSQVNGIVEEAVRKHSLPAPKGRVLKIYYSTQFGVSPPKISVIMNRPKLLHFSYKRYLINQFREKFDFEGTPLIIVSRDKKNGDREKKEESY
ncbi:ribosome-associated GTPase EngA [Thiovulum sp. ES]|nr:ribosome-associated GTPase EngA [Thiovulum sp. ES]